MKKICLFLAVLTILLSLAGCGGAEGAAASGPEESTAATEMTVPSVIPQDYTGLERYDLDCGIGLYAMAGLQPQNADGFTACLGNPSAIILVMEDDKEANNLAEMNMAEYAALVSQANGLDAFSADSCGNLSVGFDSTDRAGVRYYNCLTVKETEDSFWVFQMTCAAEEREVYEPQFAVWATSIG